MMSGADPDTALLAGAMRELAPQAPGMEPHLEAAIAQTTESRGSLLRARLVLVAARSHGLPEAAATQLACAVEYFHAASLLLDDLPCMDDAAVRRGRPCVHRVHGEATAILAALAFINRAHVLIGISYAAHPAAVRMEVGLLLDTVLGVSGLVGGQACDLRFGESATGARAVGRIAAAKTGELFKLALVLPALGARPGPAEFHQLKALAVYWGQWFQAVDDMKDVIAATADAGKDTRRDRALQRPNLVHVLGRGPAQRRIDRLEAQLERACQRLAARGPQWDYLAGFHQSLALRACAA
jgi:geranylgeranyl diphosphate synthase type II